MIKTSSFKPAWWLPNAHVQTFYSTLARFIKAPISRTEHVDLPDGDFLELAYAEKNLPDTAPLVVILHGLGGNRHSTYVGGLMKAFNRAGWRSVLMQFRGADKPNRLPRAYHSGDTADLHYVLSLLANREPHTKKAVVGISLGGNVLLKWLGEQGAQTWIEAAVAVSVPFQLRLLADKMNRGFARIYQAYLLHRLKQVFVKKVKHLDNKIPQALQQFDIWQCFWTFDDNVTAPLHGFRNVHEYYRLSSSRQYLPGIATPTLIIHAADDPFMTPEVIPGEKELSSSTTLELSPPRAGMWGLSAAKYLANLFIGWINGSPGI